MTRARASILDKSQSSPGDCDVLVIGAGPAGAVAALVLARRGFHVILCDAERLPRDKACGEGILPGGVRALQELGLKEELLKAGAQRIDALRYHTASGTRSHRLPFSIRSSSDHGIAFSRTRLDYELGLKARQAGAETFTETRVISLTENESHMEVRTRNRAQEERPITARFVILAAGSSHAIVHDSVPLRSRFPASRQQSRRLGLSAHVPDTHPSDEVDIFIEDDHEIYTSSVEEGDRVISILCKLDSSKDPAAASGLESLHARFIGNDRLPDWLKMTPRRITAASIPALPSFRRPRYGAGRILRAGDACAVTDPVAAQGLTLAIQSGRAAAETIACALTNGSSRDLVFRYASTVDPLFRRSLRTSRGLLQVARRPGLAATALPILSREQSAVPLLADGLGLHEPLSSCQFAVGVLRAFRNSSIFAERIDDAEIMDRISPARIPDSTWNLLRLANKYLSGESSIMNALKDITPGPKRDGSRRLVVADLGGGDGAMAARLHDRFAAADKSGRKPLLICVDPRIPHQRVPLHRDRVRFIAADIRRLPFRSGSIDISTASLMFHHLSDGQIPEALKECARVTKRSIVINDLVRSLSSWSAVSLFTSACGDAITSADGPQSVRRAFRRDEVEQWRKDAPQFHWQYRAHSFFRFTMTGKRRENPQAPGLNILGSRSG